MQILPTEETTSISHQPIKNLPLMSSQRPFTLDLPQESVNTTGFVFQRCRPSENVTKVQRASQDLEARLEGAALGPGLCMFPAKNSQQLAGRVVSVLRPLPLFQYKTGMRECRFHGSMKLYGPSDFKSARFG